MRRPKKTYLVTHVSAVTQSLGMILVSVDTPSSIIDIRHERVVLSRLFMWECFWYFQHTYISTTRERLTLGLVDVGIFFFFQKVQSHRVSSSEPWISNDQFLLQDKKHLTSHEVTVGRDPSADRPLAAGSPSQNYLQLSNHHKYHLKNHLFRQA